MSSTLIAPFMGSLFIILREGFEAMLIVMLIFTYLKRFNTHHVVPEVPGAAQMEKYVWYGVSAGVLLSIGVAMGFTFIAGLTHAHEEWFEGITMLLAAGVLAYLAFWCHGAYNHFQEDIVSKLSPLDVNIWSSLALTLAVTIAIAREGFEIVLFYAALFSSQTPIQPQLPIFVGGAVGLVALFGLYAIMSKGIEKIPTKEVFQYSKYFFICLALYFGYQGIEEILELTAEH
jgi:high-affinity iron transporter